MRSLGAASRLARWGSLLLLPISTACGDGRVTGYRTDDSGAAGASPVSLTDLELTTLRRDFGRLAAVAPPDVSNAASTSAAAAQLGQALFFDPRYSANGEVSCATCHIPEAGFQDDRESTSQGIAFTGRHAPSVLNAAFGPSDGEGATWQFWDGRADSLWAQALAPPENAVEMGGTRCRVALLVHDEYRSAYEAAFPDSPMPELRDADGAALVPEAASPHGGDDALRAWQDFARDQPELERAVSRVFVNFGKAIAAYESLLVSRAARFDRFRDAVLEGVYDGGHLSDSELRGFKLFIGKAGCASCHRGPNFTDGKFHNIGVAQDGAHVLAVDRGRADGLVSVRSHEFNCLSEWSDAPDPSACAVASLDVSEERLSAALGAFKTPTLRSVTRTAPYFHTGSAASLRDVVDHYARGGDEGGYEGNLDENITRLELTEQEKQDLVAFMGALDGEPLPYELTQPPEPLRR
jgi:cytochrome c peroxidase